MKQADIYVQDIFCGILREDEEGFHFQYDPAYLRRQDAVPVSPTMPLTDAPYEKEMMFPVFDGLIPEGWLLDIASKSWKINPRDRMSLLIACCKDCIGDISVKPASHE
jgi:serine/threonine-protein kinase HipA